MPKNRAGGVGPGVIRHASRSRISMGEIVLAATGNDYAAYSTQNIPPDVRIRGDLEVTS